MQLEQKQVFLRKLVASEGKVIISKKLNEEGKPELISKEIYLGKYTTEDEFEEVNESLYTEDKKEE